MTSSSFSSSSNPKATIVTGEFSVRIGAPELPGVPAGAAALARLALEKEYRGPLQGHAAGEMLSVGQPASGEATYIALESFIGTLDGREGGFTLSHHGQMHAGKEALRVTVVPGSGSGELAGIVGEMEIRRDGGRHEYVLRYGFVGSWFETLSTAD